MILSAARRLVLGRKPSSFVPYDMFDHERTARELKSATTMERIYHKGQERAWDGKAVLAELPEIFRTVLVLREFEEMAYQDIADVLGISIGTVESRLFRARAKFKQKLLAQYPEFAQGVER